MQKEKRGFVESQRKNHEHMVREHKEFIGLANKIKTNATGASKGANFPLEELLNECQQVMSHGQPDSKRAAHPVFIELHKLVHSTTNEGDVETLEQLRPWCLKNRDKLKVLHL